MTTEKKEINVEIGRRIRAQRERVGMTREQLAERVDVTPRFIADVERGWCGPSLTTLKQICVVLGVSSDSLLWDDRQTIDLNNRLLYVDEKYWPILDELLVKQIDLLRLAEVPDEKA